MNEPQNVGGSADTHTPTFTITIAGKVITLHECPSNVYNSCHTWSAAAHGYDKKGQDIGWDWLTEHMCGQCVHRLLELLQGCTSSLDYKEIE